MLPARNSSDDQIFQLQAAGRRRLLQAEPVQVQSQAYKTVGYEVYWWNAAQGVWDKTAVSTRPAPSGATSVTADAPIKLWAAPEASGKQQMFVTFPIKEPVGTFTLLRSLSKEAAAASEEAKHGKGLGTQATVTIAVGTITGVVVVCLLLEMSRMLKKRHLTNSTTESILVIGGDDPSCAAQQPGPPIGSVGRLMALPTPTAPPPSVNRSLALREAGAQQVLSHTRVFQGEARWDPYPQKKHRSAKQRKD